jgi:toxin ParE1/3/4
MKVRYTLEAQRDLDTIYQYIDERSSAAGQSVKTLIEWRIARLTQFPQMAPVTDEPGVYELSIVRHPFKVYYEVAGNKVWVLHIRHTSRRHERGREVG